MSLAVIGVEQAVGRGPVDHLGELPSEVDRVLHPDVETLTALGWVHVRGVACDEDPTVSVLGRLARRIR